MENHPHVLRRVLRGFSVSVVLRMGRLLINLVLMSLLARQIGQEGFGHLVVAIAQVTILLCIVDLGMQGIMHRDLVHEDGQWQTLGSVFFTRLLLGALCYAGLMVYALYAPQEERWLLVIYGSLLFTHGTTVFSAWLCARQQMEAVSWSQFLGFVVSAVAILIGIFIHAPLWYFAATYVVECWAALVVMVLIFRRRGGRIRTWSWSFQRTFVLLRESWFEMASQLALLLLFRLDTIMVQALRGAADAGTYGAAVRVSEVVYFIPPALATACMPALVALRKRDKLRYEQRVAEYFALSFVLAAVCAAALVFAAPPLVALLFGKDFSGSAPILVVHAWSFIPFAIGTARTVYFTVEGKLWVNLPSVLTALALNAVLNWLWIPRWSGMGAAWATLIAYTAAWVLSSFVLPAAMDVPKLLWRGLRSLPSAAMHRVLQLRSAPAGIDKQQSQAPL
jgi:PST family polysaccharide transporter